MTDPFDVLRTHVQSVALLERPNTDVDDLIASITGASAPNIANRSERTERSERSNVIPLRPTGRRRWLVAAGVTTVVVLGGAGVAAYIGSRPSVPTSDLLCRGVPEGRGSSIAIDIGADPIGQCADLWRKGDLPNVDSPGKPTTSVPRLVACTGSNGSVEVLPLPELKSCADYGLFDADVASASVDPLSGLRDGLMTRVNSGPCQSPQDVEHTVREALQNAGLVDWSVEISDPDIKCAAVTLDPERSRAVVFPNPSNHLESP